MKNLLVLVFASFLTLPAMAQEAGEPLSDEVMLTIVDSVETDLNDFLWVARPVIVFADSPVDPRAIEQIKLLAERPEPLLERDVVVILDTDRNSGSQVREMLRPRGFMLVIMGKDGEVELRKPSPWDVREITRTIDKMPLRIEELRATGG